MTIGSSLDKVVIATPEDIRVVISYIENGQCVLRVLDCVAIAAMTYDINGTPSSILCYNPLTGQNEIVAQSAGTDTQQVTFDLTRLLPKYELTLLLELVKKNCGLSMWLVRGDKCQDSQNPNDFIVAEVFGEIFLTNYTRTAHLNYARGDNAAVEEGTSVTAKQWLQIDDLYFGTRGELHTAPIVDITLCDRKTCGGLCDDDSDGCQKWLWIDEAGNVGWTDDKFVTEYLEPNLPVELGLVLPPTTIECGARGQIIVTDGAGTLWYTTLADILDDDGAAWTSIDVDVNGDDIEVLNSVAYDQANGLNWYAGNNNTLYAYNPSLGTVTPVTTVPGITANLLKIAKCGDHVLLGGTEATLMQSLDGGVSFQTVTVIDPVTGIDLDVGISITALGILSDRNFIVGTSDDRTLYTLDGGQTWYDMLIFDADGGQIQDIGTYNTAAGTHVMYMIRNDAATGRGWMYQSVYGTCNEWIQVPKDAAKTLPDNNGLNELLICPDNPNIVVAVGESTEATGFIAVGQSTYA